MPYIGQTWVLASIGAVVEMGVLSTLKRLLVESNLHINSLFTAALLAIVKRPNIGNYFCHLLLKIHKSKSWFPHGSSYPVVHESFEAVLFFHGFSDAFASKVGQNFEQQHRFSIKRKGTQNVYTMYLSKSECAHPEEIRTSYSTRSLCELLVCKIIGHLHKMSIIPVIVMISIDTQGEEHHCQEEQGTTKQNHWPFT
jgi:hypothetical protein